MSAKNHHTFVFPDDSRWDDARQAWNLAADLRPAVVVLPSTVEDVVGAVEYAVERDLRIVVQGTGHGAAVHGPLDGTLLLNMREMRGVEIDAENRRAPRRGRRATGRTSSSRPRSTASRPCTARRRTSASSATRSAAASAGSRASTASRPRACSPIELVTADGALVRADRTQNTDLFWALRGGGGGLGVIVAIEIALYDVEELVAGMMVWPWERSAEVLTRYVEWAETRTELGQRLGADAPDPAAAGHPGGVPRPAARRHRRRRARHRGGGERDPRAAARARPGDRHLRAPSRRPR